jgi:hypothetical protein
MAQTIGKIGYRDSLVIGDLGDDDFVSKSIMKVWSTKLTSRIIVGVNGSFQTIQDAITWLGTASNMTGATELLIDSGTYTVMDTIIINLPYHLNIRSLDFYSCTINAGTGLTNKPMFEILSSTFIERITLNATTLTNYGTLSTENAIDYNGNGLYCEFQNIEVIGFYDQIALNGTSQLFLFNSIMNSAVNSALIVNSTGATSIDVETNTFYNCKYGIYLYKTTAGNFQIMTNVFTLNSATQIGVLYNPTNYIVTNDPNISSNSWNNIGSFVSGFYFSRSDGRDSNIFMRSNAGYEDKNPHAKINVIDNVTTTTIPNPANYTKALFTNTNSYTCKLTINDGKFTYQSNNGTDGKVWIGGNIQVNQNNRSINVAFYRAIGITSVTGNGTTTTVTTTGNHSLSTNEVQVIGWTGGTGTWNTGGNTPALAVKNITVTGPTTFTYLGTGNGTATGGTIGQIIAPFTVRAVAQNTLYGFGFPVYLPDMRFGFEYDAIYVYTTNQGDVCTVSDLSLLVDCR